MIASWLLLLLAMPSSFQIDEQQIAELAKAVQQLAAGQPFECPKIVMVGRDVFEDAATQVLQPTAADGNELLHYVAMFYDRAGNRIVVRDDVQLGEAIARRGAEVKPLSRLLVMHEIVHAWQARNATPLLDQIQEIDRLAVQALLEGHAEYIVDRHCEHSGQKQLYERIVGHRRKFQRLQVGRTIADLKFVYEESLHFWKSANKVRPMGFDDIVARMPTQRQIAYPSEYGTTNDSYSMNWLKQHPRLLSDPMMRQIRPYDLGFVAFRALVCTLPNNPDERQRIIDNYRACAQFRSNSLVVTGTNFRDVTTARLFYHALIGQHSKRASGRVMPTGEQGEIHYAAHRMVGEMPQQRVTTILLRDEATIVEVNDFEAESQEANLQAWIEQALKNYSAIRSSMPK